VVCDEAAFFSNIPIKDVVGGIDVVSNGWSILSLELPLLTDGDLGPRPDSLSDHGCRCPVGFGLTEGDLDAASVAAMKEGDLDGS